MAHYIDKDRVVAEIERLISNGQVKIQEYQKCNDYANSVAWVERIVTYINVLSLLDTLEVKEVDLEKEMNNYFDDKFYISETWGIFSEKTENEIDRSDLEDIAKHFFELGLSVNNPITAADRGIANEIIFALKSLGEEKMISFDKEIEWVRNQVKKGKEA